MQIIERKSPSNGYETGDCITVVSDNHAFGGEELKADKFTIKSNTTLSDCDINKLVMYDSAPINVSAISQLPAFRSLATGKEAMRNLHRRKYSYDNAIKLKSNAQERTS